MLTSLAIPTINFKQARISGDRTLNEIANNGAISFAAAAWTHNLDYTNFYKTLPLTEAYARSRKLLAEPNTQFVEDGNSIRRQVLGDTNHPRLNLVILLEESLGSEFWGCLGRKKTLTPEMDKLAAEEGMLFTNLYANGNRTVRGMEGVLSSFPSLPGDSIVKRDRSDNVETLARVLKRDGYSTVFLYGGRGVSMACAPTPCAMATIVSSNKNTSPIRLSPLRGVFAMKTSSPAASKNSATSTTPANRFSAQFSPSPTIAPTPIPRGEFLKIRTNNGAFTHGQIL